MTRISIREYSRNVYKYLISGEYLLTRRGKDYLKVVVTEVGERPVVTVKKEKKVVTEDRRYDEYGCGCKKGEEAVCPKHSRY